MPPTASSRRAWWSCRARYGALSSAHAEAVRFSADLAEKEATLEQLADGVFAYTAQGDPNVGCIVGTDAILAIEARATPFMAQQWIDVIRDSVSDLPFGDLVLTHYHAVRTLGASAFGARRIVAHASTKALIDERGLADWASEQARMPRLFAGRRDDPRPHPPDGHVRRRHDPRPRQPHRRAAPPRARAHLAATSSSGCPRSGICFAGDLVEAQAAPYMGDAHVGDWSTATLDAVAALGATQLVGGRGPVVRGDEVATAIDDTRAFLRTTLEGTREVRDAGGSSRRRSSESMRQLAPRYAGFPIFEHCMPFNVQRTWDELDGIDHPRIWTAERDREVWDALQD